MIRTPDHQVNIERQIVLLLRRATDDIRPEGNGIGRNVPQ